MKENELKDALLKCATGLSCNETVEEFQLADGELKLVKKKVTTREVPPDIKAVKMLLDGDEECLSDEQLLEEKQKILNQLKENLYD